MAQPLVSEPMVVAKITLVSPLPVMGYVLWHFPDPRHCQLQSSVSMSRAIIGPLVWPEKSHGKIALQAETHRYRLGIAMQCLPTPYSWYFADQSGM